jgi:hypothetical protein
MNPDLPAAQEKVRLLQDWWAEGRWVTVVSGSHTGEKGFIKSLTQPMHKYPMMDAPGDPPLPYATILWPYKVGDPVCEDDHPVADVILYEEYVRARRGAGS